MTSQFLTVGLYSEVFLGLGNCRFARIAILGDEVAGEAGEVVVLDLPLAS